MFEGTALFFADDGESGKKSGDVKKKDGGQARQEEIRGAGIGIEEHLGAHIHCKAGAVLENSAKRFVEADGGSDIDGLARDGRVRAVNEDEHLRAHVVEEAVRIVYGNLDAHACFTGDDGVVEVAVIFDVANDVKRVGISQAIEKLAALAAAVSVENDGIDLADVGVNTETEHHHLQQRNDERKKKRRGVAANVQHFLVKDGAETTEEVTHARPPAWLGVCK